MVNGFQMKDLEFWMNNMKCKHQFFETNKEGYTEPCKCNEDRIPGEDWYDHMHFPSAYGIRAICILCKEMRVIWQTGEVFVWKRNKWKKL